MRAIAIVRQDHSGKGVQAEVDSLHTLARRMRLELSARDIHIAGDLAVLLAHLSSAKSDVVLVPSERHLRGWMDTVRRIADVWTAEPPMCWPRGSGRPYSITRPGRHLEGDLHQRAGSESYDEWRGR
ncbi:hypothetical protein [Nocardia sp. CNY236]|uniref:hypothetical protein n=1 Tax=Nocardia sp. CNY236 TaxID=1169152 RepID=UPI000490C82C|nr:hypothetical protein [Nocardia sp. CNY236]